MQSELAEIFRQRFRHAPVSIVDLRADGSNRKLYRLIGENGFSCVGVHGPDHEENRAFLSYSRSFRSIGLPVPEIYAADESSGIYIEEDLGDRTLFDALRLARGVEGFPEEMIPNYRRVIELLVEVQIEGGKAIDYSVAYPVAEFDRRSMLWDLHYFKYHYLKLAGVPFNEARLEKDYEHLCDYLLQADRSHFLYRDFQSRNIMLRDDEPWLIDYQGGRRGALQYDIASLLYDAKAALPDHLRETLLSYYLDHLEKKLPVDRGEFEELYRGFVLIRIMQAMGAYGYRGHFERKEQFLASIPYAVANIRGILDRGLPLELPELRAALGYVASSDTTISPTSTEPVRPQPPSGIPTAIPVNVPSTLDSVGAVSTLTVRIRSFSYRRGYPQEDPGHGGGFVFDCRSLHNPGRYDDYKSLCGCDSEVVEFLEREPGVEKFWRGVTLLVDGAVENYLERKFESLSVAFGCTGGQHRSVYFAERLARHLREHYPMVTLELAHREESYWPSRLQSQGIGE